MGVLDLSEVCSRVVYVAAAGSLYIYFKLQVMSRCSLVVGEFFPVHPAERFALNGKVFKGDVD